MGIIDIWHSGTADDSTASMAGRLLVGSTMIARPVVFSAFHSCHVSRAETCFETSGAESCWGYLWVWVNDCCRFQHQRRDGKYRVVSIVLHDGMCGGLQLGGHFVFDEHTFIYFPERQPIF